MLTIRRWATATAPHLRSMYCMRSPAASPLVWRPGRQPGRSISRPSNRPCGATSMYVACSGIDDDVRNGFSQITIDIAVDADADAATVERIVAGSKARSAVFDMLTGTTPVTVNLTA